MQHSAEELIRSPKSIFVRIAGLSGSSCVIPTQPPARNVHRSLVSVVRWYAAPDKITWTLPRGQCRAAVGDVSTLQGVPSDRKNKKPLRLSLACFALLCMAAGAEHLRYSQIDRVSQPGR